MKLRPVPALVLAGLLAMALMGPDPARALSLDPGQSSLIAWNATLDGMVPVLEFPFSGGRFPLLWGDESGVLGGKVVTVRKGRHAYDMRTDPAWRGRALWVALANVPGVPGTLAEPDLSLEMDMALAANQYLPASVNLLDQQSYFGVSQLAWLLGAVLAVFAGGMLATRSLKALPVVFLAAFLAGFALLGLRGLGDQALLADSMDDNRFLGQVKAFRAEIDALDKTLASKRWAMDSLPWPYDLQTRYGLAEHPYSPHAWDVRVSRTSEGRPTFEDRRP